MAISSAICNSFKQEILVGTHNLTASSGDTFKLALFTSSASLGAGTTAYSTAGASDTNGYKWYCQKFSMSANKSSHNVSGSISDYLNVYGIGGLSSSTMSKIKDAANLDAIGFVQQTVNGSSRIGNLGRAYKSTAA